MATHTPVVSIIIPLFNREEIVKETLDSVLAQTYTHWECIIVDDRSTDNSLATAKEYAARDSRFKVFERDREPKGAPTCRNIGIEKFKGDLVLFFDSDDLMYQQMLEIFSKEFHQARHLAYLACEADFFKGDEIVGCTKYFLLDHNIESYLSGYAFMAPSFVLRKDALKVIGLWDETLSRLQDVDFFSRLFYYSIPGARINKNLFKVRVHEGNITSMWNRHICESLIRAHLKLGTLYSSDASFQLKTIIGKRITAFSISALASGFWKTSLFYFFKGIRYLPREIKKNRVKTYMKLFIKKPFLKNKNEIILYE